MALHDTLEVSAENVNWATPWSGKSPGPFVTVADHAGLEPQVLDDEILVALEARAGRGGDGQRLPFLGHAPVGLAAPGRLALGPGFGCTIDEVRFTKGAARYEAAIVTPLPVGWPRRAPAAPTAAGRRTIILGMAM